MLDTSVLVAGLRSQLGASNRVLLALAEGRFKPLVTTAIFLEYEAVLMRPEHQLATGLKPLDIDEFLSAFASAAEPVDVSFLWRPQLRDPGDEMLLEAAVNGHADFVVTHNIGDFEPMTERFGISIRTPARFLKELER